MGTTEYEKKEKPLGQQWTLLDIVSFAMMASLILLFLLIFTSLGDSLAAGGQQYLDAALRADPTSSGFWQQVETGLLVESCPVRLADIMPCHDPKRARAFTKERNHYRERHCPPAEERLRCLIPPPPDYQIPVRWPESLHRIWFNNTPHNKIAELKSDQGWMIQEGDYFVFPGGGTMFPEGAEGYVQKLEKHIPFGTSAIRTALDLGCGVASFGAYLLDKEVLTMSVAPRDSYKAQIQFALERGLPAFVGMLGTQRLPFPASSFDLIHCSRCRISFSSFNGSYFIEMDRLLRPGGYFVLSGPPVNFDGKEKEFEALQELITEDMCYVKVTTEDKTAVWVKPTNSSCYRSRQKPTPAFCKDDDPNNAWNVQLGDCITPVLETQTDEVPHQLSWRKRLETVSTLSELPDGDRFVFDKDTRRWRRRVRYYRETLKLKLGTSQYRNVMDMNAVYGGFAANLMANNDPVWVMNVVPVPGPNTLGTIYDRGLLGVFHDWCEAFSTYPRTYDLLHVSSVEALTTSQNRCSLAEIMVEMDRILRPKGTVIIRDTPAMLARVSKVANGIQWNYEIFDGEPGATDRILIATKQFWKAEIAEPQ
ncbi:probable pectin methyltransferase QUA3 [Physcomitrium patens]|uniref:Methyltransferase n=1 Tax=Physcomitrium patens TaxID=3218 RepID=A0A2K1IJC6_PHYPA|nr:probable methyltransferase PMT13 [Physcomitrium patens]XP_024362861.1 probable methyltransferase PMT13 [Physcomitrium patens]XP_024362862.1 probable methyltransferase PMT13 [Physcomitrium patens]XP_024362863.1 probable methyltransferase PMT13 [Physcomitrium patens]XP_024362864.1 probable methyltransferase PMT13 [Physcomitrium patens]PNR29379.1 hypothetical protein PHYPA_028072 [Physcomitrium patens]|eukprot:XP_024362860.1 probable methyltransferase PMT13 [Physcomitrella patens]